MEARGAGSWPRLLGTVCLGPGLSGSTTSQPAASVLTLIIFHSSPISRIRHLPQALPWQWPAPGIGLASASYCLLWRVVAVGGVGGGRHQAPAFLFLLQAGSVLG